MATKPNNRTVFVSEQHGRVTMVTKSIGFYYDRKLPDGRIMSYWRGQLVEHWSGISGEGYYSFSKGTTVWLDDQFFKPEKPLMQNIRYPLFPGNWSDTQIKAFIVEVGEGTYMPNSIRKVPGKGWCCVELMICSEADLIYGINRVGCEGRYCYQSAFAARLALLSWDGEGDPPGNWISQKTAGARFNNPNFKK